MAGGVLGGTGTTLDPYLIEDVADLNVGLRNQILNNLTVGKFYKQIAPLDFSNIANWEPLATESNPFRGNYNGNGYTFNNVSINRASANHQSVFGVISNGAQLLSLGILSGEISGYDYVSSFATVVGGTNTANRVQIKNCFSNARISGNSYVGGLVSRFTNHGRIENSYFSNSVRGASRVGGLIGSGNSLYLTIENSFMLGDKIFRISGSTSNLFGDIVGEGDSVASFSNVKTIDTFQYLQE